MRGAAGGGRQAKEDTGLGRLGRFFRPARQPSVNLSVAEVLDARAPSPPRSALPPPPPPRPS